MASFAWLCASILLTFLDGESYAGVATIDGISENRFQNSRKNPEHALLLYFSSHGIGTFNLSSNESGPRIASINLPREMTYISSDKKYIYWTESENANSRLFRASKNNGTAEEMIAFANIGNHPKIEVDWITGNIYFLDDWKTQIRVCTNSGSYCTSILTGHFFSFQALALDPANGEMYWSDCGYNNARIYRADMDGKSRVQIMVNNHSCADYLTIDYPNGRLYWVDTWNHIIESMNLNGTDRRTVLPAQNSAIGSIAVFRDRLFWTEDPGNTIHYCNKFTGEGKGMLLLGVDEIRGILIDYPALELHSENPCDANPCEEICLLAPGHNYTCACSHHKTLGDDGKSCRLMRDVNHG